LNGWTVKLSPAARRQYRQLEDGPKSAAKELLEDLEAEGPAHIQAIELRANPDTWRARFHHERNRMIYQVSPTRRLILVTRIKPRSSAYEGMRGNPG